MARRRKSRHSRKLGSLGALDTGTMLIGAGVLVGLGTLAYYMMSSGTEAAPVTTSTPFTARNTATAYTTMPALPAMSPTTQFGPREAIPDRRMSTPSNV